MQSLILQDAASVFFITAGLNLAAKHPEMVHLGHLPPNTVCPQRLPVLPGSPRPMETTAITDRDGIPMVCGGTRNPRTCYRFNMDIFDWSVFSEKMLHDHKGAAAARLSGGKWVIIGNSPAGTNDDVFDAKTDSFLDRRG